MSTTVPSAIVRHRVSRPGALALLTLVAVSAACFKEIGTGVPNETSHLRVVHAVANAPAADLVVDTTHRVAGMAFRSSTSFLNVSSGDLRVRLLPTGAAALVDTVIQVDYPRAYTLFATGTAGNIEPLVVPDTAPIPGQNQFKLRFVNVSPASGFVDLYVTNTGTDINTATPVLEGIGLRGAPEYLDLNTARLRLRVTTSGTKTVLYDATQTFADGQMRTLVITDKPGGGLPLQALMLVDY